MKLKTIGALFFFYVLIITQVACSEQGSVTTVAVSDNQTTEAEARQFRINRDALNQGSSEDIRIDAAISLLIQDTQQSREALLSALRSTDNPDAGNAVCEALIKSRGLGQNIDSLEIYQEPLIDILQNEVPQRSTLAAEALLMFPYADISESLQTILHNSDLELQSRLNAIYALQTRSEPAALEDLIRMLDDPNPQILSASESALQESFGIPVGTSRMDWSDILAELKLKSPEEIGKERLLRQEMKLREVQADRDRWQKLYMDSLDKQYEVLDEEGQTQLITEQMNSDLFALRIWALDKASKFPVLPEDLRQKILSFLSDDSRQVRLETSKALMKMSEIDPAAVLLERYNLEKDPEIALAMFEALGEACFYAFSPGTNIELPKEVKQQTLNIASEKYLVQDSADAALKGAEVIRKILELNNLSEQTIRAKLELLEQRYQQSISQNGTLRADLLAVLAHLCGHGGPKQIACQMYGPLFIEALAVEGDTVLHLAAAQGISYADKVEALKLFKQYNLMGDESLAIQQLVIELAGQTGDDSDLEWLLVAMGTNGHVDTVWEAVKSICERQDARFLMDWLPALEGTAGTKNGYVREILNIAEQKAVGKNNKELLIQIQEKTIDLLSNNRMVEQGVSYINSLGDQIDKHEYSEHTRLQILAFGLKGPLPEIISQLYKKQLLKEDFPVQSPWLISLETFFKNDQFEAASKLEVLEAISSITVQKRPNWDTFLDQMSALLIPDTEQTVPDDDEGGAE